MSKLSQNLVAIDLAHIISQFNSFVLFLLPESWRELEVDSSLANSYHRAATTFENGVKTNIPSIHTIWIRH